MNIFFLNRSLNYGGAERQMVALARGLRERGHTVTVAVFYAGGPLGRGLAESGVEVLSLAKRGRWDVVGFLARLAAAIQRRKPDIVHGYEGTSNIVAALLKPSYRAKLVWGIRASNMDLSRYDWLHRAAHRIKRRISGVPDLIICNSQAGHDYTVQERFRSDRMIVIPNGIDTARFHPDPTKRDLARSELGLRDGELAVGIVARLDPMKDHPIFLQAARLVADRRPDVRFFCVGTGPEPYAARLREQAQALGLAERVTWTGAVDWMDAVYNGLDLLVSSSRFGEGFSNVVGEAMACGLPCAVTDVGDARMIVGTLGEVAPPGDARALGEAILRMLMRIRERELGRDIIRAGIVENFSIERLVTRSEQALAGVLDTP
jgi:glycosyltransferase involved in cell wall biosynthesis